MSRVALMTATLCVGGATVIGSGADAATSKIANHPSIGIKISTLGLGLEGSTGLGNNFGLRLGLNSYNYNHSGTYQSVDYDGHLKLRSEDALIDINPSGRGNFHFTVGEVFQSSKVTATGKPNASGVGQTFTINGNTYTTADLASLSGNASLPTNGTYLGIGFGQPYHTRAALSTTFDIGVVLQGKPGLTLTPTISASAASLPATEPGYSNLGQQIQGDVAKEQAKDQKDLNKLDVYPIVSFGVMLHF